MSTKRRAVRTELVEPSKTGNGETHRSPGPAPPSTAPSSPLSSPAASPRREPPRSPPQLDESATPSSSALQLGKTPALPVPLPLFKADRPTRRKAPPADWRATTSQNKQTPRGKGPIEDEGRKRKRGGRSATPEQPMRGKRSLEGKSKEEQPEHRDDQLGVASAHVSMIDSIDTLSPSVDGAKKARASRTMKKLTPTKPADPAPLKRRGRPPKSQVNHLTSSDELSRYKRDPVSSSQESELDEETEEAEEEHASVQKKRRMASTERRRRKKKSSPTTVKQRVEPTPFPLSNIVDKPAVRNKSTVPPKSSQTLVPSSPLSPPSSLPLLATSSSSDVYGYRSKLSESARRHLANADQARALNPSKADEDLDDEKLEELKFRAMDELLLFELAMDEEVPRGCGEEIEDIDGAEVSELVSERSRLPKGVELGTFCLVKGKWSSWDIARLVDFKPKTKTKQDLYVIETRYRRGQRAVMRKDILFKVDDEFATVEIAQYDSKPIGLTCDAETRAVTPPPEVLQPPDKHFSEWTRGEQLHDIRSHLQRIISEQYAPAADRVDLSLAGRKDDVRKLFAKGDISEEEIDVVFVPELTRWAMRGDRWNHMPSKALRDPEPPRPVGSVQYERLSDTERRFFVIDVLVPEAIIQICLRSFDMEGEEQKMYDAAREKLRELAAVNERMQWDILADDLTKAREKKREESGLSDVIATIRKGMAVEDVHKALAETDKYTVAKVRRERMKKAKAEGGRRVYVDE